MSRDNDRTKVSLGKRPAGAPSPLRALFPGPGGNPVSKTFTEPFLIGRSPNCELSLGYDGVSRRHCEVFHDGSDWWVKDLDSSNGTFVDGRQTHQARLGKDTKLEFFAGGPVVRLQQDDSRLSGLTAPARHASDDRSAAMSPEATGSARTETEHRRRFAIGMTVMAVLLSAALGVIFYQQAHRESDEEIARRLFSETKALELEFARLRHELAQQPDKPLPVSILKAGERLRSMKARYASLVKERELIGSHRSTEDLLIFRIARIFGEYDLSIPDDFVSEVKRYIREWQQSGRLKDAVARMRQDGRAKVVVDALQRHGLPPQFIYLAVQESNFRPDAIGPNTRFGIAKGMWQFIPDTAERYGLRVGPDKGRRRFDPHDDRFDFRKSTLAAADYLSFLFTTEAQASGLLVMSAYNWGEGNVARTLGRLSSDPSDHNFWQLIKSQLIPDETYGYVLRIYAAAVIGEDPQYFGFDFENPLAGL